MAVVTWPWTEASACVDAVRVAPFVGGGRSFRYSRQAFRDPQPAFREPGLGL
jgi:hypothetical protein